MESEDDINNHDQYQPQQPHQTMALVLPAKRDSDSLFVDEVEAFEKEADQSSKRPRISRTDPDNLLLNLNIDEDGKVAPYDAIAAEGRPTLAIYHPSFEATEKLVAKICKGFFSAVQELKEAGYINDEIEIICHTKLKRYIHVQDRYPSVKPIACLGPAGVGKSSGMNCLLNQPGAAHESGGAHRGTNLVHEFSTAWMQQTALFRVAAPYYRESQIEKLVEKHCRIIFAYLDQADEYDEDELTELHKRYETGVEFFRILLCHLEDFSSAEDAREYFDSQRGTPLDHIVKELKDCIEKFKTSRDLVDGYEYHDAESVKELGEIFKKVSRVSTIGGISSSDPHPWPIISKIQIHQDNNLLNAGVILGDTPGMSDSNQSVVDATAKYIKKAGTVLVFESFKRIVESETLDTNLQECLRLGKGNSTHLIVTMIDGQKIKAEDREELTEGDRKKLESAEEVVSCLQAEEKLLKQSKAVALQETDFEQLKQLEEELEHMPIKIALAEAKVNQVAIEIRTRDVANELRGRLRKLERSKNGPDLPVYFVSNTQYQTHLAGYEARKPPTLDIEGTGIPKVRRMLYTIPARGKSTTLSRICRNLLPSIFGSISGVLTKSPLERKQDVKTLIENVLGSYSSMVDDITSDVKRSFDLRVVTVIDNNKDQWEKKAERMVVGWAGLKSMTMLAFCRRYGRWRPKKGEPNVSWNEKVQNIAADKLAEGFNMFEDDVLGIETGASSDVGELFKALETNLDECPDFQGVEGTKEFDHVIQTTRDLVLRNLKSIFANLRARINGIRHACIFDVEESYFSTAMQQTYKDCVLISNSNHKPVTTATGKRRYQKKSTVHPQRVELLRQKVKGAGEESSVFAEVCTRMSGAFEDTLDEWVKDQYAPNLERAYSHIVRDFDGRFAVTEEVKTEGDQEAMAKLKDAADQALQLVEGPLRDHIEKCESYEKTGVA